MTSGAPETLVATINLIPNGADPGLVERRVTHLRDLLTRLDVENVRLPAPSASAPEGARGVNLAAAGTLLVELLPLVPNLRGVLTTIRSWSRGSRCSVTVAIGGDSITVDSANVAQTDRLIDHFVNRHAQSDG